MGKQLSTPMAGIIEKANKEHALATDNARHVQKAMEQAAKHAINVGQLLIKAKSKCKHGQWEALFDDANLASKACLDARFEFGKVRAAKYMKAAKFPEQAKIAAKEGDDFNLDKVYASLSSATEEKEKELIGQHSLKDDDEYHTPHHFIESARLVMGSIDVDPASNPEAQKAVRANTYHTVNDSGLDHPWVGNVFMNPPYSSVIQKFADKLTTERLAGNLTSAIIVTNNGTETRWFHTMASVAAGGCFPNSRIHFLKDGVPQKSTTKGQCFFYVGSDFAEFKREFSQYGICFETTNNEVSNEQ